MSALDRSHTGDISGNKSSNHQSAQYSISEIKRISVGSWLKATSLLIYILSMLGAGNSYSVGGLRSNFLKSTMKFCYLSLRGLNKDVNPKSYPYYDMQSMKHFRLPWMTREFQNHFGSRSSLDCVVGNLNDGADGSRTGAGGDEPRAQIVFVLGGPGAGKGTQCSMLAKEFGFRHLSAGELLRQERIKAGSEHGALIDACLREGKIVPVEISLSLLKKAIQDIETKGQVANSSENLANNVFLVDGFPRNWNNLEGWNRIMPTICDVKKVVFIDCDEQELERRIILRGTSSGRTDDNAATAQKRFHTFKRETMPIIKYFQDGCEDSKNSDDDFCPSNCKLLRIDGNKPVSSVYEALKAALLPCLFLKQ